MSHDRGCFKCGRDNWEYDTCLEFDCPKKAFVKKDEPAMTISNEYTSEVEVQLGVTKNIGDHNFVKYNVSLKLQGPKGTEDKLYEEANEWVGKKVTEFQKS